MRNPPSGADSPSPGYTLDNGVIIAPDGRKLASVARQSWGDGAPKDSEIDALARQIIGALNAPPPTDPETVAKLWRVARAALRCDSGAPSKARLEAFGELGDALVALNGAPLGFRGVLNASGPLYTAPEAPKPAPEALGAASIVGMARDASGAPWAILKTGGGFKARPAPITGHIGPEGTFQTVAEALDAFALVAVEGC